MERYWRFVRIMQGAEYTVKQAKMFVVTWTTLVFLELAIIAVTVFVGQGPVRWFSVAAQAATLCFAVVFLRFSLGKLARARAKQERTEWEAAMLAQWVNH